MERLVICKYLRQSVYQFADIKISLLYQQLIPNLKSSISLALSGKWMPIYLHRSIGYSVIVMNEIITTLHQMIGLSWPTRFFLVAPVLMFCAGLTFSPVQANAAGAVYTATEARVLPAGSTRVVRAANESGEIVGTAERDKGPQGFFLGGSTL
jgi:hypothetical protein